MKVIGMNKKIEHVWINAKFTNDDGDDNWIISATGGAMSVAADELLYIDGDITEVLAKLKDNKWYPVDQDDSPGYKNLIVYTDKVSRGADRCELRSYKKRSAR